MLRFRRQFEIMQMHGRGSAVHLPDSRTSIPSVFSVLSVLKTFDAENTEGTEKIT
jgi:hypothetical protein